MSDFEKRMVSQQIFCGTPEVVFAGLGIVVSKVNDVLTSISALQQPDDPTIERSLDVEVADSIERQIIQRRMEKDVQDIVTMLLGPEYIITKE